MLVTEIKKGFSVLTLVMITDNAKLIDANVGSNKLT